MKLEISIFWKIENILGVVNWDTYKLPTKVESKWTTSFLWTKLKKVQTCGRSNST